MTATERFNNAKQIKEFRNANFQYKRYLAEKEKQEKAIVEAEQKAKQEKEARENAGFWERLGDTFIDTFTTLGGGLLKGIEGVFDAGVGLIGGIGGAFGADTQWAEDIIKFDATDEWYYKGFENEATKNSWWNDAPIVKDVLGGVGQMLPTIALSTVGLGGFGVGGIVASAGGTGVEEALNEDAEFGQAMFYGVSQAGIEGLIEGVTAGLGKGITTIGKSIGKTTGKSVAKTVGKVMLEESVSEGIEEGLTALVNPLSKTIYKGADVLEAYKDMTFYLDVGQQALVGGIVGGITGGSGAKIRQTMLGGKTNSLIAQSAQEIATLDIKENNLWKNGKLDAKALQEIQNQRQTELENISSQLMAMSEADRVNALEKLKSRNIDISGLFNEDGSINYENTQNWGVSENNTQALENTQNTKRKPLATDNIEAYSPSLRNKVLEFAPTSNPIRENIKTAKNTIMAINPNAKVVIAENLPVGNAFYDPNSKVLYLSNKADSVEIGGHEITHSLEGTKEYKALKDYVLSQVEGLEERINQKIELYKNVNVEQKQGENGESIARYEAETEIVAEEMGKLLSDQASVDRIVRQNKSVAVRIIQWIKDAIAKLTKRGIKGEYYNYLRTAEKLYAKAIKSSFGGVSLAEGTLIDWYLDKTNKGIIESETDRSPNLLTQLDKPAEARYSINESLWNKLSKTEQALLYKAVDEMHLQHFYEYQLPNGDYLIDIENKIIISDGNFDRPSIDGVIEFKKEFPNKISDARDYFYDKITNGRTIQESIKFINDLYEEKVAIFYGRENSKYDSESERQRNDYNTDRRNNEVEQREGSTGETKNNRKAIDSTWGVGFSTNNIDIKEYNLINLKEDDDLKQLDSLLSEVELLVQKNQTNGNTIVLRQNLYNILTKQVDDVYSKLIEINNALHNTQELYNYDSNINVKQIFIQQLGYNGVYVKSDSTTNFNGVIFDINKKKRNLLDFSPERAKERLEKAIKLFGETDNPAKAGWLLSDGRFVDYNRDSANILNEGDDFVLDYQDHFQIEEVFDSKRGYDAIDSFMAEGNIDARSRWNRDKEQTDL